MKRSYLGEVCNKLSSGIHMVFYACIHPGNTAKGLENLGYTEAYFTMCDQWALTDGYIAKVTNEQMKTMNPKGPFIYGWSKAFNDYLTGRLVAF